MSSHRFARRIAALAAPLALAACVAPEKPAPRPAPVVPVRPPVYPTIGLESVMGKTARMLEATLGKPRLDIQMEGPRMLQYASNICVLDAYLYPASTGAEPVVRYVDARLPDGRDVDRASCVSALIRREEVR